jgi:hypothetical protein
MNYVEALAHLFRESFQQFPITYAHGLAGSEHSLRHSITTNSPRVLLSPGLGHFISF